MRVTQLASVALLATQVEAADWKEGACPDLGQNKSDFNLMSMAGMWFEYVWDQGFTDDYGYQCSTWLILQDKESFVALNHMLFDEDHE